jgi:MFS family permease
VNFVMMDKLAFTPVEMTMAYGVIAFPWCVKPVFGYLSDNVMVFDWGKRRAYISLCGLVLAYLYVATPNLIASKTSLVTCMTTISFFLCFADVCADCITVDLVKDEEVKGKTQGNCWTFRAIGSVCGAMFGGTMYEQYGSKAVFQIMSIPCFLMCFSVWWLPKNTTQAKTAKDLCNNVYEKRALAIAILLMNITPDYGTFITYFLRRELQYTPEDFQWISMAAAWSFLLGTYTYKTCLLKVNPIRVMYMGVIGSLACRLLQLFITTGVSTSMALIVMDTVAESLFGMFTIMPLIVVIAHNAKSEGTFYALLMSLSNFGAVVADELGGLVGGWFGVSKSNFDNLSFFVFICIASRFVIQMMILSNKSYASYFPEGNLPQTDRTPDSSGNPDHTRDTSVNSGRTRDSSGNQGRTRDLSDSTDHTRDLSGNSGRTRDLSGNTRDLPVNTPDSLGNRVVRLLGLRGVPAYLELTTVSRSPTPPEPVDEIRALEEDLSETLEDPEDTWMFENPTDLELPYQVETPTDLELPYQVVSPKVDAHLPTDHEHPHKCPPHRLLRLPMEGRSPTCSPERELRSHAQSPHPELPGFDSSQI